MSASDLITILGESSFAEQIGEVAQFAGQSDEKRAAYTQQAQEAADDASKQNALISEVIPLLSAAAAAPATASSTESGLNNDREVEGVFNLASALILSHFQSDDEARPLLEHLVKALTHEAASPTNEKAVVRYRVLSNIFNSLPANSPNRCLVFNALVQSASSNDDVDLIADALANVPNWLAEWNISASEKSSLLQKIADALDAAGDAKRSYDFLLLHLRFLGTSAASDQSASASTTKEAAERTVAKALGLTSVFEFEELSQVAAVQQLGSEPIGKLLNIFLQGQTKDWIQWRDANAAEITRLHLSAAQLERKIRLLDLANLCSQSISSTVSYAEIANVLSVDIDDVEVWVIDVIRAGLVSGKLSQINQSLRVYKSIYRTFGTEQWKLLESRLSTWEKSISSILQTLADARQSTSVAPAPREAADATAARGQQATQQSQITA